MLMRIKRILAMSILKELRYAYTRYKHRKARPIRLLSAATSEETTRYFIFSMNIENSLLIIDFSR